MQLSGFCYDTSVSIKVKKQSEQRKGNISKRLFADVWGTNFMQRTFAMAEFLSVQAVFPLGILLCYFSSTSEDSPDIGIRRNGNLHVNICEDILRWFDLRNLIQKLQRQPTLASDYISRPTKKTCTGGLRGQKKRTQFTTCLLVSRQMHHAECKCPNVTTTQFFPKVLYSPR